MTITSFSLVLWAVAALAGFLGSLTGLGGGVVLVPLLVLGFGVDIRYAAGASLISVIATSSGAAAAYVREGFTNIRIGMLLEVATTLGALSGASMAAHIPTRAIALIFGAVLLYSAFGSTRPRPAPDADEAPDRLATRLRLDSSYPGPSGPQPYHVRRVPAGFGLMYIAGVLSGLLGIGSGAAKVIAMDRAMRLPFKVSTTTSNFMIGVTAAASAGIYFLRGNIDPLIAAPVALGVLGGSMIGTRLLARLAGVSIRIIFFVVLAIIAVQMILKGFGVSL